VKKIELPYFPGLPNPRALNKSGFADCYWPLVYRTEEEPELRVFAIPADNEWIIVDAFDLAEVVMNTITDQDELSRMGWYPVGQKADKFVYQMQLYKKGQSFSFRSLYFHDYVRATEIAAYIHHYMVIANRIVLDNAKRDKEASQNLTKLVEQLFTQLSTAASKLQ